jgi:hydroxyethylthiazole kinase-like uncharacterized protein yjeF
MSPRFILTAAETRAAEERLFAGGTKVVDLMERAGQAVAEAVWRYAGAPPVLVLCGPGNNGGDGYVIARALAERGVKVRVAASGEPRTDAAWAMHARWARPIERLDDAGPAPLLVDALFGTGLTRPLAAEYAEPFERLARAARCRIAVDLPSGIGTDDGALLGPAIDYDLTVALGSLKPAHRLQPAVARMGRIVVADIDIGGTSSLVEVSRPHLPAPGPRDHKYTRGHVVVVQGAMPGAGLLAATAAQRGGAGYVTLVGAWAKGPASLVRRDEDLATVIADRRVGAIVIGPGLGRGPAAQAQLHQALASIRPLVLDADALALLADDAARLRHFDRPPVLTPHEGEFVRLFGELPGSRIDRAREAALRSGAVVVLKGPDTVIATPEGRAAIAAPSPGWLASAGTGDILAGTIGACLARGMTAFDAACAGVWLHAEAARRAGPGLIADDLPLHLSAALASCA